MDKEAFVIANKVESVTCSHCGSKQFREEKIVELDNSVMIRKGMTIPAQALHVSYQYVCSGCSAVVDEEFSHGHLSER